MHLIEILLPLNDNLGQPFDPKLFRDLRKELTDLFGGVTAFDRMPAIGETRDGDRITKDKIVILEVMAEELDRDWWKSYRENLEGVFDQDEIVIRSTSFEKL